jgi:TRAP-type mannitol/chloroaromatic compound transport system permease small subunit
VKALLNLARGIDALNERLGYVANWLVLLACLISAGNAFSRYGFNMSSNAWLEIQWYMFAGMVMLGAAYTLRRNEHVRVDIIYGGLSTRKQVWVDIVGTLLFLLTSMTVLAWTSWGFFHESWRIHEMSASAGGLLRWPVKILMPLGFSLIVLQGLSEVIKRIGYLRGQYNMDLHYERPLQ